MELTKLEIELLESLKENDGNGGNIIYDNIFHEEYYSLALDKFNKPSKIKKGVVGSLVKKGYLKIEENRGEDYDNILIVTNKGLKYFNINE